MASYIASISGTRKTNRLATIWSPRRLRRHWHLCIGDSKRLLPSLLEQLREVDLFHHDSLHTYDHMMWEYETAFPWLSPTGVLSSHDVNATLSLRRPFRPVRSRFFASSIICELRRPSILAWQSTSRLDVQKPP